VARFTAYDARHVYGGEALVVRIADPTAREWYDRDWPPGEEIALLQRRGRLRAGARVINAGAHQGVMALILARAVGPTGQVIGVEPVPHNVRMARRNASANGCDQLEILHAVVSDTDGIIWFEDSWNGSVSGQAGSGIEVPAVTIDTLAARYGVPDVLFIDVEGFELHVLRGATRTVASYRPDLFIEAHVRVGLDRYGTVDDLLSLIPSGYEVFVAPGDGGDFVPVDAGRALLAARCGLVAFAPRTSEIRVHD
jgi:FkbM family methyltransferase